MVFSFTLLKITKPMEQDKAKLKAIVDNLYISPQHYENIKATEFEILLMSQVKKLKDWANKEIEKL